jgi:hypothetical protein
MEIFNTGEKRMSYSITGINRQTKAFMPFSGETVDVIPNHEKCPSGFHTSGVMGGWDCDCACHKDVK